MKLSVADLNELAVLAIEAATAAGQMIADSRPQDVQHKPSQGSLASQVVTEVDRRSERIILDILGPSLERFGLGLLTEEQQDDGGRLIADHFWCIDPLDGTLPFIEDTRGYAVSIALVRRDGRALVGVVYDPVESTLFHSLRGSGTFRDGRPWPAEPPGGQVLSVFADRSFLSYEAHDAVVARLEQIAHEMDLGALLINATGGAVMNACQVLAHPPACYFKFPQTSGGGSSWDFAATACLFQEHGATATDIFGGPLDLNRADTTAMNHRGVLFATSEVLAAEIRALYSTMDTSGP